jgi:adenylate kinase
MINMVFLGPPGAGKGTQSEQITKDFDIVQVSTGDILRLSVKEGTDLGKLAKEYMDKGELVPDDVIIGLVRDRLQEKDCANGFILDGFPRTIPQAEALDEMLERDLNISLSHVISLEVNDDTIVERLTGRRVCENCKKGYHITFDPPKTDNICDNCGGRLIHRDDDKKETIMKRLQVYHNQTEKLKKYYSDKDILQTVDGEKTPENVYKEIVRILS